MQLSHLHTASKSLPRKSKVHTWLSCWQLYVMSLPAILYLAIFSYKPMYGILIAFKRYNTRLGVWGSEWCGFDNFQRLFRSPWFPIILKNTLTLSLLSLVISFPLPILLALMLNELKNTRIRNTIQTVSYAPHFISTVVMCGMIFLFLSPSVGIVNQMVRALGGEAIFFMQSNQWFKWVYVLSGAWQNMGWNSIIYMAALSGVDHSLLEAADIDGATRLQKIMYINFPVLLPTIVVLLILQCGSLLSIGYEKVYLLQTDANLKASEVISTYVYKIGLIQNDYSFSTATGIFNSVVNSAILLIANTISRKVGKVGLW